MSFVQKIASSYGNLIYLVQAVEKYKKEPAWYYVLVDKIKLPVMERKIEHGLNILDYGQILYSGWGNEPPIDIKDKIKEQYG